MRKKLNNKKDEKYEKINGDDDIINDDYDNSEEKDIEDLNEDNNDEDIIEINEIDDIDEKTDILIEVEDEDILNCDSDNDDDEDDYDIIDVEDTSILSKHKIEGKHSLKYDSIFKGKKNDYYEEEYDDEDDSDNYTVNYIKDTIELDKSSLYYMESVENERYIRSKMVKEKVYEVLKNHTKLNFLNNRRKPSKSDFNHYFSLLKEHLVEDNFTNIELFNELAIYFSDNLFNMFKLLDAKWRNLIIKELQDHIGKIQNNTKIINKNIRVGTEIEFNYKDEITNTNKLITGVVIETDYKNSLFKVNSYENIYEIKIDQITKILNNSKIRYNLNKLNNIDFI